MAEEKKIPDFDNAGAADNADLFTLWRPSLGKMLKLTWAAIRSAIVTIVNEAVAAINLALIAEWNNTKPYVLDELSTFGNRIWKSKANDNLNNEPPSDPEVTENAWWIEQSKGEAFRAPDYAPGVFTQRHSVVVSGGLLHRLIVPEIELPYNSTDLAAELLAGDWEVIGGSGSGDYVDLTTDQAVGGLKAFDEVEFFDQTAVKSSLRLPSGVDPTTPADHLKAIYFDVGNKLAVIDPTGVKRIIATEASNLAGNVAYVEKYGDDVTGQIGNRSAPFLTIQAALDALDLAIESYIIVGVGLYDERLQQTGGQPAASSLNIILEPGVTLQYSGASGNGSIFNYDPLVGVAERLKVRIYGTGQGVGSGSLIRNGINTGAISDHIVSFYNLDTISNSRGSTLSGTFDYFIYNINKLISTAGIAYSAYRNCVFQNIREISSSTSAAISLGNQANFGGGLVFKDIALIKSTGSYAIQDSGNINRYIFDNIGKVESTVAEAIRTRCMNYMSNAEIISRLNASGGHCVNLLEAASPFTSRFKNCRFIATHVDALAIKTAANISVELDNVVRNRALDTGFTITDILGGDRDYFNTGAASYTENFTFY